MINKTLPIIFILTLSACAAPTPRPTPPELVQASQPNDTTPAWRICWFRTTWPEGRVPRWEVDMLLAQRLLGPIIAEQENNIQSWRFHRRAFRDDAGHQDAGLRSPDNLVWAKDGYIYVQEDAAFSVSTARTSHE